jgi:glutaredoxin
MFGKLIAATIIALFFASWGCSSAESTAKQKKEEPPKTPLVTKERTDLVLSWQADGGPHIASSVADVPESFRKRIRVQDPTIPPEKRNPRWIFFTDLTTPGKDGRYPVEAIAREQYEREKQEAAARAAEQAALAQQKSQASTPPAAQMTPPGIISGGAPVIMYATRHCPVCKKARRWLLEQKIPYVEKDIERDQKAAEDLARKGAAQKVPVNGVPVFEIGGHLLPGFDPGMIKQLLAKTLPTVNTV